MCLSSLIIINKEVLINSGSFQSSSETNGHKLHSCLCFHVQGETFPYNLNSRTRQQGLISIEAKEL